jgi:hypothetical protein
MRNVVYKKEGAADRHPVLLVYFLYAQRCRLPIDDHYTFHTQQSSAYEKQGASIYIYPSSGYISKTISIQIYKLTKFIATCRKRLHHGLRLADRTTIIIGIIDCREVILGHEMLSGIIYTVY